MLLEIESNILGKALSIAAKIAAKKTGTSSTSCVLLVAEEGKLKVSANNLTISFLAELDCAVAKTGTVMLLADKITALVKTYSNTTLTLKSTKNGLSIIHNESKHNLTGFPVDNFPRLEDFGRTPFKIDTQIFAQMLNRVSFLVTKVEGKPQLSGINIVLDKNKITLNASDSLRVSTTSFTATDDFLVNANFMCPEDSLTEIAGILSESDSLEIGCSESSSKVYFRCGNYHLSTNSVAQNFPDISKLFFSGKEIVFNRRELLNSLSRTSILADKVSKINEFAFSKGKLRIKVDDELGSSDEIINISCQDEFSVLFRIKQMTDFLTKIQSETVILVYDREKPTRFNMIEPSNNLDTKYLLQSSSMR